MSRRHQIQQKIKKWHRDALAVMDDNDLWRLEKSIKNQIEYSSRKRVGEEVIKQLTTEHCYIQYEQETRRMRRKSFKHTKPRNFRR